MTHPEKMEERVDFNEMVVMDNQQIINLLKQMIRGLGLELYKVHTPMTDSRGFPYTIISYEIRKPSHRAWPD